MSVHLKCIVEITEQTFELNVSKNIKLSDLIQKCKSMISVNIPFKICIDENYLYEDPVNLQDNQILYIILDDLPENPEENDSNKPPIQNTAVSSMNHSTQPSSFSIPFPNNQTNQPFNDQQGGNMSLFQNIMGLYASNPQLMQLGMQMSEKMIKTDPQGYSNFCGSFYRMLLGQSNNERGSNTGNMDLSQLMNFFNNN